MTDTTCHPHEDLVRSTVAEMRRQGMAEIKADHLPEYDRPSQIGSFIPDTTGIFKNQFVVTEAESAEGLTADHTLQQWRVFQAEAARVGGYFIVVVNKPDETAARALLRQACGSAANTLVWLF